MSAALDSPPSVARAPEVVRAEAQRSANVRAMSALFYGGGSYTGASGQKRSLREWWPLSRSADQDTVGDLPALRARSLDLERNSPIAGAAVENVVQSVVGDGLKLSARINRKELGLSDEEAEEWEARAEQIFRIASTQLDITNTQTRGEMEDLALRSQLGSGDVLVIRRFFKRPDNLLGTKLQLVEAGRVSTPPQFASDPDVVDGVRTDADGAHVGFYVRNRHRDDRLLGEGDRWSWVPARGRTSNALQAFLLFSRTRPGQTRGVPYLAPVIEPLKQLERYTESELTAAVVASMFTVFVKSGSAEGVANQVDPTLTSDTSIDSKAKDLELGSGAIIDLLPGEEIQTANPGRPNAGFDPFTAAVLTQVGARLGQPYEVIAKRFMASYSASRAALLEAWRFYRRRRSFLANGLCNVEYEWVISEAILSGLLAAPGFFDDPIKRRAWLGATWTGPAPGSIDPKKEVEGYERLADNGWISDSDVTQELRGVDFDETAQQIARDRRTRARHDLPVPDRSRPFTPDDPPGSGGGDMEE